jgi:hypothetical protein
MIESLESLIEPQYRTGIESIDTEKLVSIDSSSYKFKYKAWWYSINRKFFADDK